MKRLSKILKESAWGDMMRRSSGDEIRKEDELNNKSPEEFVDYLKDHYVINDYRVSDIKYIPNRFINIPVALVGGREYIHTWHLTFNSDIGELTISSDLKLNAKKLWPKLIKKFKLHDNGSTAFVKDKSINNTYALEFIDFIIDNIDDNVTCCISRKTNESAWGDMMRRSSGEIIRKEDDINIYDGQQMAEYINDHYTTISKGYEASYSKNTDTLSVSVIERKINKNFYHIDTVFYEYDTYTIYIAKGFYEDTFKILMFHSPFSLSIYDDDYYSIIPKKGDVNNRFFLEVIDFIIDNTTDKKCTVISRKTNESAWGDMMRRSSGEITRKEDTLNIKDMKPIDLGSDFPVYWADIDLEVNGEDRFDWEDVQKMIPQIEKTGWRLPKGPIEIRNMFGKDIKKRNEYLHRVWDNKGTVCKGILSSDETGETLEFIADGSGFYVSISYWCESDYEPANGNRQQDTERSFDVSEYCSYEGNFSLIAGNNEVKTKRIKIRLVKDK